MGIPEVQASFNELLEKFHTETARIPPLVRKRLETATIEEIEEIQKLGTTCYGHMTTSLEDLVFWMKRLADALEG